MNKIKIWKELISPSWELVIKNRIFWLLGLPLSILYFGAIYNFIYLFILSVMDKGSVVWSSFNIYENQVSLAAYFGNKFMILGGLGISGFLYLIISLAIAVFLIWIILCSLNSVILLTFDKKKLSKNFSLVGTYFVESLILSLIISMILVFLLFAFLIFFTLAYYYGLVFKIISIIFFIATIFVIIFEDIILIYSLGFVIKGKLNILNAFKKSIFLIINNFACNLKMIIYVLLNKCVLLVGLGVLSVIICLPFIYIMMLFNTSNLVMLLANLTALILITLINIFGISLFSSFKVLSWSELFLKIYKNDKKGFLSNILRK